jgi:hypothetical protein
MCWPRLPWLGRRTTRPVRPTSSHAPARVRSPRVTRAAAADAHLDAWAADLDGRRGLELWEQYTVGAGAAHWEARPWPSALRARIDAVAAVAAATAARGPAPPLVHVTVVAGAGYAPLAGAWVRVLERAQPQAPYLVACLDATACGELTTFDSARDVRPDRVLPWPDAPICAPLWPPLGDTDAEEPTWFGGAPGPWDAATTPCTDVGAQPPLTGRGRLWWRRLSLVRQLLRTLGPGVWLAMSDADAMWQGDPTALVAAAAAAAADVVASAGSFPADVHAAWDGATVCMGLVLWQSNARTLALLGAALDATQRVADDQAAVNRLLAGPLRLRWADGPVPHALAAVGVSRVGHTERGVPLTVLLLSAAAVPRTCDSPPPLPPADLAYHCRTPPRPADKVTTLRALGLWPGP